MSEGTETEGTAPGQEIGNNGGASGMTEPSQTPLEVVERVEGGRRVIGKVASPPQREATTDEFYFWVPGDELVERTQIAWTQSQIGGHEIEFYAVVDDVFRQSRKRSLSDEYDAFDGDLVYQPPFAAEGITFAKASILRAHRMDRAEEGSVLTPPREQCPVYLGGAREARVAYSAEEIENPLLIGLVKNGGSVVAGAGVIDLDYLLGANGGHLNVTGAAGRGSKSSFLLHTVYLLLAQAQREAEVRCSDPNRLRVVPIIFNVKNYDLFYIDRCNSRYRSEQHDGDWHELGIEQPGAFQGVTFRAPQQRNNDRAVVIPGHGNEVQSYSWGLEDIIREGLFPLLFSEEDTANDNFSTLLLDLEALLTDETFEDDGTPRRRHREVMNSGGEPLNTFARLADWAMGHANVVTALGHPHHDGTVRKLARRLRRLVLEGRGVLRRDEPRGDPLNVQASDTQGPVVIDLHALAGAASLQRFVVATVLRQLVDAQTGPRAMHGLMYLVVLDEVNRFAPRGGRDPITRLVELVASELRSQGILLFGAQQQASLVSEKVIENAGIRALGKTGVLELNTRSGAP
jgi:hypothetical protein